MNGIISKFIIATTTLLLVALTGCNPTPPTDDSIYFVHSDHLNVPTVVTDKDKAIVWEGHRTPFGETEVAVATIEQPFRFPGQYYDSETGLHYNLMRDYDPRLGRYVQSDPIGLAGGISTYGYAGQNPLMAQDPNGELFFLLFAPWLGMTTGTALVFDVAFALALVASVNNVNVVLNSNDGGNVIPFPGAKPTTGDTTSDPDCPDKCELERNSLIIEEIRINNDASSGPPRYGNTSEFEWAAQIKERKRAWNKAVDDYNRRCPRKIGRRYPV